MSLEGVSGECLWRVPLEVTYLAFPETPLDLELLGTMEDSPELVPYKLLRDKAVVVVLEVLSIGGLFPDDSDEVVPEAPREVKL